jgi:hypothetical protein
VCWGPLPDFTGLFDVPAGAFDAVRVADGIGCGRRLNGSIDCWPDSVAIDPETSASFPTFDFSWILGASLAVDGTIEVWPVYGEYDFPVPSGTFTEVSAGGTLLCGVRTDGVVICAHRECACTDGPFFDECRPSVGNWCDSGESELDGTYVEVASGATGVCARTASGDVSCWTYTGFPYSVATPPGVFTQIDFGRFNACGILTDGSIVCWGGENKWNENDFEPGQYTKLSVGWGRTCALRTDGHITCCGGHVKDPITGEFIPPP